MRFKKVITIITILFLFLTTNCLAKIDPGFYEPGEPSEEDYKSVVELASTIVGALTTVGIVVAVVGIIIIGIKYMTGSVEQKAEYKKTMVPYLVGCVFIFAISTIVSIIYNLVTQL